MSVQHILQQILASLICHQKGLQEWCEDPPLDRPSFKCLLWQHLFSVYPTTPHIESRAKKWNFSRRRKFSPCFLPPSSSHTPPHTHNCLLTHPHFTDHKRRTKHKSFIQGLKTPFSRACPRQPSSCLLSQLLDNIASRIRWMQRALVSNMAENIWTSLKLALIFKPKLLDD